MKMEAKIAEEIPVGRWVRPDEVGELVVNLASQKMASLTGTTIVLDGGASLKNK
jgi:3-oxoacyl-[acyl-carrier protein] reductase